MQILSLKIAFIAILFAFGSPAFAHDKPDHYDRVHLSASAQTQVGNDTVIVTLYAQEEGGDASQLADIVNQRIGKALQFVKRHNGVKVQTNSYSTRPVYQNNKITGWRVSQSMRLESRDMALMSDLLGVLQRTLALQSMNFTVSPELKNRTDDTLIIEALKVFEQRAMTITKQLQRRDYKIVDINISTGANRYPRHGIESMAMARESAAPALESGEQTVQVTVTGEIELE